MSEPVGLGPRSDIPAGNSHRSRNAPEKSQPTTEEERPSVEKVVTGRVTTKKKSWIKRMTGNIIAEDAGSIGEYLAANVIVPALKNLIADSVTQGTNHILGFEPNRNRRSGGRSSGGDIRTRYDNIPTAGGSRALGRDARATHNFDEIILDSRQEAIDVLDGLESLIQRFRTASVADLYDLVGVTGSYADRRWGWADLITADIRPTRGGGYRLDLPAPEPLRR